MKLNANEKASILTTILSAEGLKAATLNKLLDLEKGNGREAQDARIKVNKFVKCFDAACLIAEKLKLERRGDKPLSSARRSLERLCSKRPALERFRSYAKSGFSFEFVKGMLQGRTTVSPIEAVAIFTNSISSSDEVQTVASVERHGLANDGALVRVAKSFCERIGFKVA